jgi:hypothetical protein
MLHRLIVKMALQELVQPEITRNPSILEVKLPRQIMRRKNRPEGRGEIVLSS